MNVIQTDITTLDCDDIVNAANSSLLGGGGVDGAIHRAAGPDLLHECRLLDGCKTGEAKITKAYRLPAKHIIHTVGPVWNKGGEKKLKALASCYQNCLLLCEEHQLHSIAFPCISTGVYRFPKPLAAEIAVKTCKEHTPSNLEITFCCFEPEDLLLYEALLST